MKCSQRLSWSLALFVSVLMAHTTDAADTIKTPKDKKQQQSASTLSMLPGVVEPSQSVTLSASLDGVLMSILVHEGDEVRRGQVLAVMDNRVAAAAVRLAEKSVHNLANIELADSQLRSARSYFQRVAQAHEHEAASDLELDQARSGVEQAEKTADHARELHEQARAQLDLERARMSAHELTAPFDGRVIRIEGKVGQSMTRSDPVMMIVNVETLRVELHVPVKWFRRLDAGNTYQLAGSTPVQQVIPAQLLSVEPVVDAATQTFRCLLEIDNSNHSLPAGFAARLVEPDYETGTNRTGDLAVSTN